MESSNVHSQKQATVNGKQRLVARRQKTSFDFNNSIKTFLSRFSHEDFILIAILFILIEEGVDDELLILAIVLLILTDT